MSLCKSLERRSKRYRVRFQCEVEVLEFEADDKTDENNNSWEGKPVQTKRYTTSCKTEVGRETTAQTLAACFFIVVLTFLFKCWLFDKV